MSARLSMSSQIKDGENSTLITVSRYTELGDLINLEVLKLRQNGFSELPAESGNLRARKQAISATFQTETLPTVRESLAHYDIFA